MKILYHFFIIILLLFTGCGQDNPFDNPIENLVGGDGGTGSLTVNVQWSGSSVPSEVSSLYFIISGDRVETNSKEYPPTKSQIKVSDVGTGNVKAELSGRNSNGESIYKGESSTSINKDETKEITVTMNKITTPDTTRPTVTSTSPSNNATNVPVTTTITATFSEAMDSSTINTSSFTLKKGTTSVSGSVTYDFSTNKATFTPSSNLSYSTTYTATITTGVKDSAGNAMASNYTWSFTTEAKPVSVPSSPTGVSASAGDGKITINWSSVSGATSYTIYIRTSSGVSKTNYTDKKTSTTNSYTWTGLTNGTTYYYVVTAVNSYGESSESSQVSATPSSTIVQYTLTAAKSGTGSGTVTSSPSGINCGSACSSSYASGTAVTLTATADTDSVFAGWSGGGCSSTGTCTVTLSANTIVTAAFNTSSTGTAPSAPTGVSASAGDGQATISWSSVSGATSYNIYWSTTTGVTKTNGTKIPSETSPYTHT